MTDRLIHTETTANGIERRIYMDDAGKITTQHYQDVEPILDHNAALATHDDGYSKSRDLRRVASIPMTMVLELKKKGIDIFKLTPESRARLKRVLNSSEYNRLRTAPGRM